MLPAVREYNTVCNSSNKLLIIAEGFESRALAWLSKLEDTVMFDNAIICEYVPPKKSRYAEVLELVTKHTKNNPKNLKYNRFEP